MKKKLAIAALSLSIGMQIASAQTADMRLDADSAEKIIAGCKAHATAKGQSHGIAVYDKGGNLIAALRMTGNSPGILAFAQEKAKAAAMWRFATAQMEKSAEGVPGFARAPYVETVGGGVPVFSADGKTFLGGAGASGEPPEDDASCIVAGIEAAGLLSQRVRN